MGILCPTSTFYRRKHVDHRIFVNDGTWVNLGVLKLLSIFKCYLQGVRTSVK